MSKPKIDVTWGNADFLIPYWTATAAIPGAERFVNVLNFDEGMRYEKEGGREDLKEAIRDIHNIVGNAVAHDKHIVIGNGATQLLLAALVSLNELYDPFGCFIRKPHYMRFSGLVTIAGLTKISEEITIPVNRPVIEICTIPNNPDNAIYPESIAPFKIHDLCYNWPQYMPQGVQKRDDQIMIFGMAKATGHAGSRIGWALIKSPVLAEMMAYWIELTSNGVSVEAQDRTTHTLRMQSQLEMFAASEETPMSVFTYGKEILSDRWKRLLNLPQRNFRFINKYGMFAMIEFGEDNVERDATQEFFRLTGILGVAGDTLGAASNHIRINVGCSGADFNRILSALSVL